ncbi:MAG: D-tyrosyl-tRNA(Tyr) deacylase [Deltaproteobacteria bacterium]|nr:D-tyrosyl-tRNA(Tyr) deacylase [Deltaproteobacteria bacterium]
MRAVIQRVTESSVRVKNEVVGKIGRGMLVLLGVSDDDKVEDSIYLSEKIVNLRIFEDEHGKMNRSLVDIGGEMLVVSQFTLLADCRKGRRPSFVKAASPEKGEELYRDFSDRVASMGIRTAKGRFGAMMAVSLINDGPVTIIF